MTNPRQERRQHIERLFEAINPNWLFGEISPYSADFWMRLAKHVGSAAKELFLEVSRQMHGLPAPAVLENAWGIAVQKPLWLALLARSVDGATDKSVLKERSRLVRLTRETVDQDCCARAILDLDAAATGPPPDLSNSLVLMPGLRLRYALAHRWASGASTMELWEHAGNQGSASTFLRARELLHAMAAKDANGRSLPPLSPAEFEAAPPRLQAVTLANRELKLRVLHASLVDDPKLQERIAAAWKRAKAAKRTLVELRSRLREQDLVAAEALLRSLSTDLITCDQAEVVFARCTFLVATESRRRRRRAVQVEEGKASESKQVQWVPLSGAARRSLRRILPALELPSWWGLTSSQIAKKIANGRLPISRIPSANLSRIASGWGQEEHAWLVAGGHFDLVPDDSGAWEEADLESLCRAAVDAPRLRHPVADRVRALPDARSVLALLSSRHGGSVRFSIASALESRASGSPATDWASWVANCIGTPEWHAGRGLACLGSDPIQDGLALLQAGRPSIDPHGFRAAMCSMLASQSGVSPGEKALATFLDLEPAALPDILRLVPVARLASMVGSQKLAPDLLSRIQEEAPAQLREALWSVRLVRANDASSLRAVILERADRFASLPWHPDWLQFRGPVEDKALALVLASRNDPERLRSIGDVVGADALAAALRAAAGIIPPAERRERGYLQLAAELGISQLVNLRSVLFLSDRAAPVGCKFDRRYREYLLPKKSGGNRVISVPPRRLKRVQRAILDTLLTPLGAHEAAFGFVRKRSIRDNATVHVGQSVVANADVKDCFPSVKWSLVLAALRRDLGKLLGPEAISLVVDICTAKGGLPIGAPTSPALLNRVLLRTDEIVQRAATARECRYTRYADDLTFSGDRRAVEMLGIAKRTLSQIGLRLDEKKTTIYRPGRRQMVTGLVVNHQVAVPRRIRRRIRAAVHALERGKQPHWHGHESSVASLGGRLAYLGQIHPEHAARLKARLLRARATKENSGGG